MKQVAAYALIITLLVPLTWATAEENEFEGYKRYPVESGIIEYKVSGSQTGTETLYFDRWGLREVKYTDANMMGNQRSTITLMDGKWTYQIDLGPKTGQKMETPMLKALVSQAKDKELFTANEEMMKSAGAEKLGTETIAGKECDVWEIKGANTKVWLWNWVSLKTEMKMGGMEIRMEAVSVKIGEKIPAEKFAIPEGITITEVDPKSMMRQN